MVSHFHDRDGSSVDLLIDLIRCRRFGGDFHLHGAPAEMLYRIVRDDRGEDTITRLRFGSYNEAYDELERFYAGLCCSDDRVEYAIEKDSSLG